MKRLFLAVILAALVASIVSPMAVSAGSRKTQRGFWNSCAIQLQFAGGLNGDRVVYLVRTESQVVTPDNASTELQNRVSSIHAVGCGAALDYYVHARVGSSADYWYDGLHAYLGLTD